MKVHITWWMLNSILPTSFTGQIMVELTNPPLTGLLGEPLVIGCTAFFFQGDSISYNRPEVISLVLDDGTFISSRLSSVTNATHKIFTLNPLQLRDSGARIRCALSELQSPSVSIEVLRKCVSMSRAYRALKCLTLGMKIIITPSLSDINFANQ